MTIRSFIFIAAWLCANWAGAATITTTTDRNRVGLNESFQIIFKSDATPDGEPDFSPLEQQLRILNRSRASSINIANGSQSRTEQWTLTVMANQTGTINIPAIQFGRDKSQPVFVEVTPARTGDSGNAPEEIFIEIETSSDMPYLQAQVLYTIRLFRAVATSNASLSEPKLDAGSAVVEKLGDDKVYETRRGRNQYQVIERQYAIYPQKSGVIRIEPIVFRGRIGGGLFIDPFGPQPRSIVKHSRTVRLQVRPIPKAYTGDHWLPAANVTLLEKWSADSLQIKQGEPITRTLQLQAQALPASQLPAIEMQLDSRLKRYPDQPELTHTATADGLLATLTQKAVILPAEVGQFTLPAIKIPWWNTATRQQEYAELPARRIAVVPTAAANGAAGAAAPNPAHRNETAPAVVAHSTWKWLFFSSLSGWLVTVWVWWRRRPSSTRTDAPPPTLRKSIAAVRRACKANDPEAARRSLLIWACRHWPAQPPCSLGDVAARCDSALRHPIMQLNQYLYGPNQQHWQGVKLRQAFNRFINTQDQQKYSSASRLEPLYRL